MKELAAFFVSDFSILGTSFSSQSQLLSALGFSPEGHLVQTLAAVHSEHYYEHATAYELVVSIKYPGAAKIHFPAVQVAHPSTSVPPVHY